MPGGGRPVCREGGRAELAPDEAAASRADREQELGLVGQLLAGLEQARFDAAQEVLGAKCLSLVGEGDCRPQPAANECAELVLGLGEAAGGDCRPLRLECERLSCGERVELDRPIEPHGLELLFLPDLAHFARLPDEVRAVRNRHDEILGEPRRLVLIAWKTRLHQIEPALDGQVDGRSVDGVERALRERGKARMLSTSSPKSSIRSGSRPVVGYTSTMPPRSANWPRSCAWSTRS